MPKKAAKIFAGNFCYYFSLLQHATEQTFFLSLLEQTLLPPQVTEQTIYFSLFAEQSFLEKKTKAHLPQLTNVSN